MWGKLRRLIRYKTNASLIQTKINRQNWTMTRQVNYIIAK